MTVPVAESRRRRGTQDFGPSARGRSRLPLGWLGGLTILPVVFCVAHFMFGANQPAAALWLSAVAGLALVLALATPLRSALHDVTPSVPLAVLFSVVIGVALWTLTPLIPGGAHPLWAWAGGEAGQGASTLDRSATLIEIVKLLGLAALFVVGALQGTRRDRAQATVESIVWVGGIYAALALLAFMSGLQVAPGGRLTGGFQSANNGATVFGILTVIGLAAFLRAWKLTSGLGVSRRLTKAAVPLTCLSLCAVCLVLTASRMGIAAMVVSASALLLWETVSGGKGRRSAAIGAVVVVAIGVVLTLGGNALVWGRIDGLDADAATRGELFGAHWSAFVASPLFGYGLGTFDPVNMQIMTAETAENLWTIRATHNVYLQWLEEAGLIGSLPMFALIGVVLGFATLRASGSQGRSLHRGLVCASLVVLVHGLTDYALQVPSIAAFWAFLLGLQLTYGQGRG